MVPTRIRHPLSPVPPVHQSKIVGHPQRGRDRRASFELRCGGSFHQFRSPVWEVPGAVWLIGAISSGMARLTPRGWLDENFRRFTPA
jgi:hypothetical protein